MKLTKVEISAFRIYDDPEDATFDLTSKAGKAASFVSVYAPNGFGKTSFYDAIEYGFTESVDRFYLRAEELEKLANVQSLDKFIRNTNSQRNTYVKIFTDNPESPVIEMPFRKHGNQKHDLNLDKNRRKEHPFQKVILSQEWISAFLTESDGEARYKKFMTTPELAEIDNYYNNLKHLIKAFNKTKEELLKQIAAFEAEIEEIGSENLLETVNTQITIINSYPHQLPLRHLTLMSTREEVIKFQSEVAGRMVSSNKKELFEDRAALLITARDGSRELIGANQYFELIDALRIAEEQLKSTEHLLTRLAELTRQRHLYNNKVDTRRQELHRRDQIQTALKSFDEYERVQTRIKAKEKEKEVLENELFVLNDKIDQTKRQLIEDTSINANQSAQRDADKLRKQQIPGIELEIARLSELESTTSEKIADQLRQEIELNRQILELGEELVGLEQIIAGIREGSYPTSFEDDAKHLAPIIESISANLSKSSQLQIELGNVEGKILSENQLKSSIAELISLGTRLISQSHTSICPLCEADHNSFDILLNKVTNNNALDASMQTLMSDKARIENEISQLRVKVEEASTRILKHYQGKSQIVTDNLTIARRQKSLLALLIENERETSNLIKEQVSQQLLLIRNMPIKDFETELDRNIEAMSEKIAIGKKLTDSLNAELLEQETKAATFKDQITLIKLELESLSRNEQSKFVAGFLSESISAKETDEERLEDDLTITNNRIETLGTEVGKSEQSIRDQEGELAKYEQQTLESDKRNSETRIQGIQAQLNAYTGFIKEHFDIDLDDLDLSSLLDALKRLREDLLAEQEQNKKLTEDYQKLDLFCQPIGGFLKSENSKIQVERAKQELDFLVAEVEPKLNQEHLSARKYLEEKVKDFFHVDLIDTISKTV